MVRIVHVHARQVLDSRGTPTVEAEVTLEDGTTGRAIVPSGASTGRHEALELRDGDPQVYGGKSVGRAIAHVNGETAKALAGMRADDPAEVDRRLLELDGTPEKRRLGANATLGVSMAVCVAAARARGLRLYAYIAEMFGTPPERVRVPLPMVNILSGGLHAGGQLDIQDILFVPVGADTYSRAMQQVYDVYHAAKQILQEAGYDVRLVADEGGLGPALSSNEEGLAILVKAMERAGLRPGVDGSIAVDVASSHFYEDGMYLLQRDRTTRSSEEMVALLAAWTEQFPIVSLEDGLAEDDWEGWRRLTARVGARVQLLGDDLFTTSVTRLKRGIEEGVANAILIKLNQAGTVSETLEAIRLAQAHGFNTVVSARSGETEDTFMADLAVGTGAGQIKVGSITRSERLAKYNRLFRIEEWLGHQPMASPFRPH